MKFKIIVQISKGMSLYSYNGRKTVTFVRSIYVADNTEKKYDK